MPFKKLSGFANRKRNKIRDKNNKTAAKILAGFLHTEIQASTSRDPAENVENVLDIAIISPNSSVENDIIFAQKDEQQSEQTSLVKDTNIELDYEKGNDLLLANDQDLEFDNKNIESWPPFISKNIREHIINMGFTAEVDKEYKYPVNSEKRHFSADLFYRNMHNKESFLRSWMYYSKNADRVFCISCKLFNTTNRSSLTTTGNNDWKHIYEILKSHENSPEHLKHFINWVELSQRLHAHNSIDENLQRTIRQERDHWQTVLDRLCNIILYITRNNLALRGSSDKLYAPNNGNFLGLVELLGKYDMTLHEHLSRIVSKETHVHYCSYKIQNELISLLASSIRSLILERAIQAKYYSIILDCTPDISHIEQLSFTLRFVDVSSKEISIKEHFITYVPIEESTGQSLYEITKQILRENNLDIINCRGQGYDNGSNMKGKNKGVQSRMLQENSRAFFMPCGCHTMNLVLSDSASSCTECVTFFGIIQRVYTLFSASVGRWKILTDSVPFLTVKPLCTTRWESRINSLKPFRFQIVEIHDALITLGENGSSDAAIRHEAQTLATQICDFGFIVTLVIWYNILYQVNIVSKSMQSASMDLSSAVTLLDSCINYIREYRISGFERALIDAKQLADNLDVDDVFVDKRIRRKKRQFMYEMPDEIITNPHECFKIRVFNVILDKADVSLKERFKQLKSFQEIWGFLFKIKDLPTVDELKKLCEHLEKQLRDGTNQDINSKELCIELQSVSSLFPRDVNTPMEILNFIRKNGLENTLPNVWIALRILLTIPVTVASGERSFSKLKLIKTYLRSSMSQERLNSLALLSIENELINEVDISEVVKKFADVKARKKFM